MALYFAHALVCYDFMCIVMLPMQKRIVKNSHSPFAFAYAL